MTDTTAPTPGAPAGSGAAGRRKARALAITCQPRSRWRVTLAGHGSMIAAGGAAQPCPPELQRTCRFLPVRRLSPPQQRVGCEPRTERPAEHCYDNV